MYLYKSQETTLFSATVGSFFLHPLLVSLCYNLYTFECVGPCSRKHRVNLTTDRTAIKTLPGRLLKTEDCCELGVEIPGKADQIPRKAAEVLGNVENGLRHRAYFSRESNVSPPSRRHGKVEQTVSRTVRGWIGSLTVGARFGSRSRSHAICGNDR